MNFVHSQAEDLRPALQTMVHIYNVVEAVQNTKFPGFSKDVDEERRTAEQKAKEGERPNTNLNVLSCRMVLPSLL